jgi:SAM-dependent methyltransferase/uncharacterized protein YbaR (Trm112 family)
MHEPVDRWLSLLRCPADGGTLGHDGAGPLVCDRCGSAYPVEDGICRFVGPGAGLDSPLKRQEMAARDAEAPGYDEMFSPRRNALDLPPCLNALAPRREDRVAEIGCGTGRLTLRFAHRVECVIALDFSWQSLRLLRERLPARARDKVVLAQADACAPPLAAGAFSKVACFDTLQHLPTPEARRQAVRAGARLLAPGGTFTCTAYHWSRQKRRAAARGEGDYTRKHGLHESGIPYWNFEEHELRELWGENGLRVDRVEGLTIGFRGAGLLGPLLVPVHRLLAPTRWGLARAQAILIRGRAAEGACPEERRGGAERATHGTA